jgi:hypothetical protein
MADGISTILSHCQDMGFTALATSFTSETGTITFGAPTSTGTSTGESTTTSKSGANRILGNVFRGNSIAFITIFAVVAGLFTVFI